MKSLDTTDFLDTYVCMSDPNVQILYSYFRYSVRLFFGWALFVARCNIIRALVRNQEEKLSY